MRRAATTDATAAPSVESPGRPLRSASFVRPWMGALLVVVPLALSAIVHFSITRNYFFSDDFLNLYRIKNDSLVRYLLTPHGGHTLVVRNAIFFLCARAFDTNPAPYFWVAWLTHLINVALLFSVLLRLTRSARLACFGATLWGVSPLHAGALGWYSVYGHVVATTALLLILEIVVRAGAAGRAPTRGALLLCYGLALVAMLSFGVGVGFAFVLPFVIAWLAPEARRTARWGIPLLSLVVVVPLLYLGLFWLNGVIAAEGLETPGLLTKLAFQLGAIIPASLVHLMAYGIMSLCLGFAFQPDYYSDPLSYAVVGGLALCGLLVARRASPDVRRALAASALLALACYGIIVAGRVVFFASYSSATLAMQPRYHYAGLLPLTLVLCLVLGQASAVLRLPAWAATALLLLWLALLTTAYTRSGFAIDHHAEAKRQTDKVLGVIRARIATRPPGSEVFIENRGFAAFPGGVPKPAFPGWASVFIIFYPENVVDGRRVHFVDRDLGVIVASARGRRSRGLLVLPQ